VRAPEPLRALRLVAASDLLDALTWPDGVAALRFAADDMLALDATTADLADEPAIIEDEVGFVGWWLTLDEVRDQVIPHVDWPLRTARLALAQGLVAGVPAKLWLTEDRALLLCAAAYAHELMDRLP